MSEIQIFNNPQFGEIRTAGTSENPLFCLSDLCKCLGLSAKGVNQRLSDEVISNYPITDKLGRTQQALFVNEDGLYDVILDSRKPEARAFRKWVTSEVLPSIRKTGGYSVSSSAPVLTSSFDISNLTGRPHARIMKDIRKILEQGAGADDFFKTCRPVETECGTRDYEAYDITPKGLLTLATGYPPLLRDRIAAIYAGITGGGSAHASVQPPFESRTEKPDTPETKPEKKKSGTDHTEGSTDARLEMEFLKERIRRMEKQLRRIAPLPDTPNEDIFRQYPQYHSISVPVPTPDDLYNSMTFDNVRKKLYSDLGIEFSPISLSEYLAAHGFVTNEGKDRLKPTKKAVDDNWILYPVEIPDEEDGIRLWNPRFTERGYMILVSRIRDYGAFEY